MEHDGVLAQFLETLSTQETWRVNKLPPEFTIDVLRSLDLYGWIEFRLWHMVNRNMRPFDDAPLEPMPNDTCRWFSPRQSPLVGGDLPSVVNIHAENDWLRSEVRLSEKGKGQRAEWRLERTTPSTTRPNERTDVRPIDPGCPFRDTIQVLDAYDNALFNSAKLTAYAEDASHTSNAAEMVQFMREKNAAFDAMGQAGRLCHQQLDRTLRRVDSATRNKLDELREHVLIPATSFSIVSEQTGRAIERIRALLLATPALGDAIPHVGTGTGDKSPLTAEQWAGSPGEHTKAFVLTDIVGSEALTKRHRDKASCGICDAHLRRVEQLVRDYRGYFIRGNTEGDSTKSLFHNVHDALRFAIGLVADRGHPVLSAVRIGVNIGPLIIKGNEVYGGLTAIAAGRAREDARDGGLRVTPEVRRDVERSGDEWANGLRWVEQLDAVGKKGEAMVVWSVEAAR